MCPPKIAIMQDWIEILVPAPVSLVDGVAEHLVRAVEAAKHGVEVRKGTVVFWVSGDAVAQTLADTRKAVSELAEQGWQVDPDRVRAGDSAPEEDWRDAWKKHFHATRLTRQFVVVPSWEQYQAQPGDLLLELDPGQAFGTGAHASTQLVLIALQDLADRGQSFDKVLDIGTGSGILAIACTKLWSTTQVRATDIDPLAVSATSENCARNGVADRVRVGTEGLGELDEQFPLVLANIQAHVLRELRDAIVDRLLPGGHLVLSGILSSQMDPLAQCYTEAGLSLVGITRSELDPEWSSAHLRKP